MGNRIKEASAFILTLLLFNILVTAAVAVSFTASSSPTSLTAGQSSQLLNFSIQDTGAVNATQVNITLPPGVVFTGTSGTSTSSPYISSFSTPSWVNSTSIGIIGNGATQYFWLYVNTPNSTGSSGVNLTVADANNAIASSNVTITLIDTTAPQYSSNTTSPATNSTYTPRRSYWFNVTWTDNVAVSTVLIEHNLTGSSTPHNETMNNSGSVYYWNLTDLAAGTYVWRTYATDTNSTVNATSQFVYTVQQANNTIYVYINGTLNGNTSSINNTAVNITVNATCSNCPVTISRDGTSIVSGVSVPYIKPDDVITSVGLHNYTVTTATNTNYTAGSVVYFVGTVPSYTAATANIPSTFSNVTLANITITFNSTASLTNVTVQGDWSGTAVNYSMSNISLSAYNYSAVFPAGTYYWKIFGSYLNYSFNMTPLNSFTINRASPVISLNATPQWVLDTSIQTNVTCTLDTSAVTPNLYRNGTSVNTPDIQTFPTDSTYLYLCNTTTNTNYTTYSVTNTLIIKPKTTATLSFVQWSSLVQVVQNSSASYEIDIKNTGNVGQNTTLNISGIDSSWYSVNPAFTNILVGTNGTYFITFNIGNADVNNYPSKFGATSINGTITQDFTLRVLPSNATKLKINDTLALYKLEESKLEDRFNGTTSKGNNTAAIEQNLAELKATLSQIDGYITSNNYFQAQLTISPMKALIDKIDGQLKAIQTPSQSGGIPTKVWLIIIGAIVLLVVGSLAYLFWPVKEGYKPKTGEYVYNTPKEENNIIGKLKNFLGKFKNRKEPETKPPEG
ncbi:MAG: hypothetical protein HYW23_02910 [Candidatus Aenigmarchaeota archaeon]|nr:hypothetical protein [Candidatus Aenigmarchaeota archaeon]